MESNSKERLLYIYKVLYDRTDENNPLSTSQIIDIIEKEYGIDSHRTTISKDIDILKNFGVDIVKINSTQNKYFIASRKFEIPELKLLIDAVESSKFITQKKSEELVAKLASMASRSQSDKLKRNLDTPDRIKPGNEQIYYIVDTINDAINQRKKISFQYYEYSVDKEKKLKNNGMDYIFSPYTLVWNGDYYYMVGFSDKHQKIVSFRVDRIAAAPHILSERIVPKPRDFNIAKFTKSVFKMFESEHVIAELKCDNSLMKVIIDHFGEDVRTNEYSNTEFIAKAEISASPTFFGWIFGFSGKIQILGPQSLKNQYRDMVKSTLDTLI